AISFEINDSETLPDDIQISWHTSYPVLIPDSNITVNGSGKNKELYLNLNPETSGRSIITLTITDAGGLSDSESFTLIVQPVDDPPKIQIPLEDVFVIEDAKEYTLDLNKLFTDVDNEDSSILISILNNTHKDLVHADIIAKKLILDFMPDKNGIARLVLLGVSNGQSITHDLNINISPVDDGPEFSNPPDITQNEDAPQMLINMSGWFTDPDNDDNQISYQLIQNTSPDILKLSIVNNNLYLNFIENANGESFVQIAGYSNGCLSATTSFIVRILPVNDVPVVKNASIHLFEDHSINGQVIAHDVDQDNLT
ncbi:hypothetical protein MHK_008986, partial [Candidatus Magnetomorum sp. HK-1]